MVTCPQCKGKGGGQGIRCGLSGCQSGFIKCSACDGSGQVTEAHATRMAQGRQMHNERVARRVSLRAEAERLGISMKELSDIEHGRN